MSGDLGKQARSARGFTLVEALISVGVVGVLLSLIIPALRDVKRRSMEVASMARLAQIGHTIAQYTSAHDDMYPQVRLGVTYDVSYGRFQGGLSSWPLDTYFLWFAVVADVAPFREHAASWIGPAESLDPESTSSFVPTYMQCNAFAANPALWTDRGSAEARANPAPFLTPVRIGMVAHPSSKIMFHDGSVSYDHRPIRAWAHGMPDRLTPVLAADGHAEAVLPSRTTAPFRNPLGGAVQDKPWHNTPNGVRGVDLPP